MKFYAYGSGKGILSVGTTFPADEAESTPAPPVAEGHSFSHQLLTKFAACGVCVQPGDGTRGRPSVLVLKVIFYCYSEMDQELRELMEAWRTPAPYLAKMEGEFSALRAHQTKCSGL